MAIEIYPNLFVGNIQDLEWAGDKYDFIISACKEPCHRNAVGYITKSAPQGDNYYFLYKTNRLILNLVDSPDVEYIPKCVIDESLKCLKSHIGKNILVHCNDGNSRAPSIALMYLASTTDILGDNISNMTFRFKELYQEYNPTKGMKDYVKSFLFNLKGE